MLRGGRLLMTNAVLSVGSNMGDRLAYLRSALDRMRPCVDAVSPVYETPPWGPVSQPDYLNAVILASDDTADPPVWLARAHAAEEAAGRVRDQRWGPRTLDVDVIAVDDIELDDPDLTLPHPRAAERAFVLVPWLAVDPEARLSGGSVADLVAQLPPSEISAVRMRPDLVLR
jgi:2-amino-4-hydroxy-6-hydroxymethyldihydropteridine diphosphokinase